MGILYSFKKLNFFLPPFVAKRWSQNRTVINFRARNLPSVKWLLRTFEGSKGHHFLTRRLRYDLLPKIHLPWLLLSPTDDIRKVTDASFIKQALRLRKFICRVFAVANWWLSEFYLLFHFYVIPLGSWDCHKPAAPAMTCFLYFSGFDPLLLFAVFNSLYFSGIIWSFWE